LKEETGLDLDDERFIFMEPLNCKRLELNYNSISLIMFSMLNDDEKKQVKNMEPNKCEKWIWVSISQLRNNLSKLFYPLQDFLNKYSLIKSIEQLKERVFKRWNNEKLYLNCSFRYCSEDDDRDKDEKGDVVSIDSGDSTYEEESFLKKEYQNEYCI
jgi:hypothetical protein